MIKVLVNGAFGRMGKTTVAAIEKSEDLLLVGQAGRDDNLKEQIISSNAGVVVDFSVPAAVFQNAKIIMECGVHPVIGTSGLNEQQIVELQNIAKAKKLGGIIAPNFSIASNLMLKYAADARKYIAKTEIIEMHHDKKIDAPSGTALKTAQVLQSVNNKEVPIHSVRLPGVLADQQIIFGGFDETLTISHRTISREAFMTGVILSCKKVLDLTSLVYGLENIL